MKIQKLDGSLFKSLIINGAANLKLNYKYVDSLNVFPVPDGDTGTNMKMTIEGGVAEISTFDNTSIYEVTKKLSRGMLMGARGNSGVILSQLFRGFSKGCTDLISLNSISLSKAFDAGVKQAYKAVMKPTEGTILTVARMAAEKMLLIANSKMSINEFFDEYLQEAKNALAMTPDMLPVLKESGVVDSGGAGYICIIEGMQKALNGEIIDSTYEEENESTRVAQFTINPDTKKDEYGYCTEFLLQLSEDKVGNIEAFNEQVILDKIAPLGNSIVMLKDEGIVKTHIHTLQPGVILNIAQEYGEFIKLKIENMSVQHSELTEIQHVTEGSCACGEVHKLPSVKPEERSKYSVVSVATGDGIIETFKSMGVDYVVSGGQSMNPSTEDFINGFDTLNADNIIVFPNNKNIQLAAEQAAKIYEDSNVIVIPTKTISQGFCALTMLDLNDEPEELANNMKEVIKDVHSIQVTYAIRDTVLDGLEIHKDDYIALYDNKIVTANRRRVDTCRKALTFAELKTKDIVTIFYGKGATEKQANDFCKYIKKYYSNLEVELIKGDQEVYTYILAIE